MATPLLATSFSSNSHPTGTRPSRTGCRRTSCTQTETGRSSRSESPRPCSSRNCQPRWCRNPTPPSSRCTARCTRLPRPTRSSPDTFQATGRARSTTSPPEHGSAQSTATAAPGSSRRNCRQRSRRNTYPRPQGSRSRRGEARSHTAENCHPRSASSRTSKSVAIRLRSNRRSRSAAATPESPCSPSFARNTTHPRANRQGCPGKQGGTPGRRG